MGIWHLAESLEELENMYSPKKHEQDLYNGFRNDRRRKEWLVIRILLANLIGPDAQIMYHKSGKPYLKDSTLCISITHTIGYMGVRLAFHPVALDMEYKSDRVLKLIPRFVSEKEKQYIDPTDQVTSALIIWSAKESLYKLFDFPDLLFDEHLSVSNLDIHSSNHSFLGHIHKDNFKADVTLYYEIQDDLILVYC